LMAVDALADKLQDFRRGFGSDIGGDERVFELFEDVGVDFLASADGVLDFLHEAGAGFLNAGLEAFEKTWFGRGSGRGAEKRLKHGAELLV